MKVLFYLHISYFIQVSLNIYSEKWFWIISFQTITSYHLSWLCDFYLFIFLVNFIQARIIWEKGASSKKMLPSDWPIVKAMGHFLD